jgi:hypothetical protein
MSRTSILATTAIVMFGTTSLIPVDATARTFTSYAPRSAGVVRNVSVSRPVAVARPTFTSTSHVANMARLSHVNATTTVGGLSNVRNNATAGGLGNARIANMPNNSGMVRPTVASTTGAGGLSNARVANTPNNSFTLARGSARAETLSTAQQISNAMDRAKADNAAATADRFGANADRASAAKATDQAASERNQAVTAKHNGDFVAALEHTKAAINADQAATQFTANAALRDQDASRRRSAARADTALANSLANGGPTGGNKPGGGTDGQATTPNGPPTVPSGGATSSTGGATSPSGGQVITVPPLNGQVAFPTVPTNPPGIGGGGFPRPGINGSIARTPNGQMLWRGFAGQVQQVGGPIQVTSGQGASPQPASAQAPSTCLQKSYLQSGFVMFNDVCTNERAVNSTTTQVASAANCLTKQSLQGGGVMFQDTCTGESAQNSGAR